MSRSRPSSRDKAVELLARRAHFEAELRAKLEARGYEAAEIDLTLTRLTAEGYLNERQTALDFVAARRRRSPEGRRRLAAELARRGAPEAVIAAALEGVDEEQELELARRAAARWWRRGGRDRGSLARHLERKGFDSRAILVVLRERGCGSGSAR